jgi:hypothetical protein
MQRLPRFLRWTDGVPEPVRLEPYLVAPPSRRGPANTEAGGIAGTVRLGAIRWVRSTSSTSATVQRLPHGSCRLLASTP